MERRIQDYLAGRLSNSEAEEFEARMFADDELAAEVERALEIRAASQGSLASPDEAPSNKVAHRASSRLRPAWALAAGVAALALGLTWIRWQASSAPVFRGAEQRMGLEVEVADGTLNAHWTPFAGAARYELQIFAADGRLMHGVEVATATAQVDLRGTEMNGAAGLEVAALDEFGQTLTRSQRVSLTDAPSR